MRGMVGGLCALLVLTSGLPLDLRTEDNPASVAAAVPSSESTQETPIVAVPEVAASETPQKSAESIAKKDDGVAAVQAGQDPSTPGNQAAAVTAESQDASNNVETSAPVTESTDVAASAKEGDMDKSAASVNLDPEPQTAATVNTEESTAVSTTQIAPAEKELATESTTETPIKATDQAVKQTAIETVHTEESTAVSPTQIAPEQLATEATAETPIKATDQAVKQTAIETKQSTPVASSGQPTEAATQEEQIKAPKPEIAENTVDTPTPAEGFLAKAARLWQQISGEEKKVETPPPEQHASQAYVDSKAHRSARAGDYIASTLNFASSSEVSAATRSWRTKEESSSFNSFDNPILLVHPVGNTWQAYSGSIDSEEKERYSAALSSSYGASSIQPPRDNE